MASFSAYDVKEIVFTNLILLGFDPVEAETKYKLTFSRDMFDLPNRRAMEVVVHFLFYRMDSNLAKQELRDCWPILDKKQEQTFRKAASNWLAELAKDPMSSMPRVTASTLMSPSGERFYLLLLHLTTFALRKAISQECRSSIAQHVPVPPSHTDKSTAVYEKLMQSRAVLHCRHFLQKSQELNSARADWATFATDLADKHRELSKRLRKLESKIQKAQEADHARLSSNLSQVRGVTKDTLKLACQVHGAKQVEARQQVRRHSVSELRKLRSQLEGFLGTQMQSRDVLESVLVRSDNCLDASSADFKIPDILLQENSHALQSTVTGATVVNGHLNLTSAVQVCDVAIAHLSDELKKGVPDASPSVPELTSLVELHQSQLASVQALRKQLLEDFIPELENAVQSAKDRLTAGIHTPCKGVFRAPGPVLDLVSASPGLQFPPTTGSRRVVTPLLKSAAQPGGEKRSPSARSAKERSDLPLMKSSPSGSTPAPAVDAPPPEDLFSLAHSEKAVPISSLSSIRGSLLEEFSASVQTTAAASLPLPVATSAAVSSSAGVQDSAMLQRWEQRLQQIRQHHQAPVSPLHAASPANASSSPGWPSSAPRVAHGVGVEDETIRRWAEDVNRLAQQPDSVSHATFSSSAAAAAPGAGHGPGRSATQHESTASPATALVDRLLASPMSDHRASLSGRPLSSISQASDLASPFPLSPHRTTFTPESSSRPARLANSDKAVKHTVPGPSSKGLSPAQLLYPSPFKSPVGLGPAAADLKHGTVEFLPTARSPVTASLSPTRTSIGRPPGGLAQAQGSSPHADDLLLSLSSSSASTDMPARLNASQPSLGHQPAGQPSSQGEPAHPGGQRLVSRLHDWEERLRQLQLADARSGDSPRVQQPSAVPVSSANDHAGNLTPSERSGSSPAVARSLSNVQSVSSPSRNPGTAAATDTPLSVDSRAAIDQESPLAQPAAAAPLPSRFPVTPSFARLRQALAVESPLPLELLDDTGDIVEEDDLLLGQSTPPAATAGEQPLVSKLSDWQQRLQRLQADMAAGPSTELLDGSHGSLPDYSSSHHRAAAAAATPVAGVGGNGRHFPAASYSPFTEEHSSSASATPSKISSASPAASRHDQQRTSAWSPVGVSTPGGGGSDDLDRGGLPEFEHDGDDDDTRRGHGLGAAVPATPSFAALQHALANESLSSLDDMPAGVAGPDEGNLLLSTTDWTSDLFS